jgi:5-methyltetrahydrofolate--homocysteine methyltransferase
MSDILQDLNTKVQKGDIESAKALVKTAIDQGIAPMDILENGLRMAMEEIGKKFETLEVYLPDLIIAADAMIAGVDVLKPHLSAEKDTSKDKVVMLGTVEGDVHDIGKNIIGIMLEGSGFRVVDLGSDVPVLTFIDKIIEVKPDIVGMSALMTTTMFHMPRVIKALQERNIRDTVKVIVGGAPVLPDWATEIGADGYGENAMEAVNLVKELAK